MYPVAKVGIRAIRDFLGGALFFFNVLIDFSLPLIYDGMKSYAIQNKIPVEELSFSVGQVSLYV